MKFYKNGFTLVELLLIFFFLFLIMAALVPIVTRVRKEIPDIRLHGFYACYRDEDGQLRQSLIKSSKVIDNNVSVSECKFEKPKKAMYYYLQIIGAGGGGADGGGEDKLLSDSSLDITAVTSSTKGAIGYSSNNYGSFNKKTSELKWNMIKETDFEKLDPVTLKFTGVGEEGYDCETAMLEKENGLKLFWYGQINGCTTGGSTGGTNYYCIKDDDPSQMVASSVNEVCADGWTKKVFTTTDICHNSYKGSGNTYYSLLPLTYGLMIHEDSTYTKEGDIDLLSPSGTKFQFERIVSGFGVKYSWNEGKDYMKVLGGEGAIKSMHYFQYYDPNGVDDPKVCLAESDYKTIRRVREDGSTYTVPENASCETTISGKYACSTEEPSDGYDPSKIIVSQDKNYQTQKLSYGVGAYAGEVKTMILRDLPDNIQMIPGMGGEPGKPGGDTKFGKYIASGGDGTTAIAYKDLELIPVVDTATTKDEDTRYGEKAVFKSFLKFVMSYKLKALRQNLEKIGSGGNGVAVKTDCTYGFSYTPLQILYGDISVDGTSFKYSENSMILTSKDVGDYDVKPDILTSGFTCNGHTWHNKSWYSVGNGYWEGALGIDEEAQKGGSGAIIIAW